MSLDYSRLLAVKMPCNDFCDADDTKDLQSKKNASQAIISSDTGKCGLERLEAERKGIAEEYSRLQENKACEGRLRSEILKGIAEGQEIYSLFLKAVECIGLMTGDRAFTMQSKEGIRAIYGYGLNEKAPLLEELRAIEARIERLKAAEGADQRDRERIANAIQAHERKAEHIRGILEL